MIAGIDHFVLTVASLEVTCEFYQRVLGFERIDAADRPTALAFGTHKINVHEVGRTFEPKAKSPTSGSGDFCLITDRPLDEVRARLAAKGRYAPAHKGHQAYGVEKALCSRST
ncbi:VOC family protein, partial [Mesorhizobium sp. M7A.F.Ca.US.006.01.1.1]|uniref:VOC family protein n=1 Tax=Mesorhizobium sp. M7A.F.Ca.US.006.01.1.1 TaxID=2496707 RepID=UPI001FE00EE3